MATKRKGKGKGGSLPTAWLGDPLPEEEAAMWASLSVPQRGKAIQRMRALDKWIGSNGTIDVEQARVDAGMKSVTRMYEMGKAWRDRRSLKSLGAFAGAPKTRVGAHDAPIRKVLAAVVAADPNASVRKLALDLESASGLSGKEKPAHNTFRRYVEEEKRRREQKRRAGGELLLDCSACTLTPSDTALLTMFAIMDEATQLILGAALGQVDDSVGGYALAARDAISRLGSDRLSALSWVIKTSRAQLVVGLDAARWTDARAEAAAFKVGAPLEPSTKDKRFGRYLRSTTGLRIGTVVVLPKHTASDAELNGLMRASSPTVQQVERLGVEVDDYNAGRMAGIADRSDSYPTEQVRRLLDFLAARAS